MLGLGLVLGCADAEGTIFVGGSGSGSDDGSTAGPCVPGPPIEGNDPAIEHGCGEACDTDWCSCTACVVHAGASRSLAAGDHQVRIVGGASGLITYDLSVRAEGRTAPLAAHIVEYDGLFEHVVPFRVATSCTTVELRIEQTTALCSRIYEIRYEPGA